MRRALRITVTHFTVSGQIKNSFWDCNTEQIPSLVDKQYISSAETILRGKSYRALRFLHFLVAVHYRTWQTILLICRKLDGILSI